MLIKSIEFNYESIPYIPNELVDIIIDYLDYEKYYKPLHIYLLKGVINNIGDLSIGMCYNNISPKIAWKYFGGGYNNVDDFDEFDEFDEFDDFDE